MDIETLKAQLEEITQERDELRDQVATAEIDTDEFNRLTKDKQTAEEKLAALEDRVKTAETDRDRLRFTTKKKEALNELGLKPDDPAVKLAFPGDDPMPDEQFNAVMENLKALMAGKPKETGASEPKAELDEKDNWAGYKGGVVTESEVGAKDEQTEEQRNWEGRKLKFRETANPRDLARGGIMGKVMRVVQRRTPGGHTWLEREEVR